MKKTLFFTLGILLALASCTKQYKTDSAPGSYAKGADISWFTEQEADGVLFYNDDNQPEECISLLRSIGMNSVRLRVWVNHTTGWCNKEDVVQKAVRAAEQGMRLMIDFHYSDNFADPSHQATPAAWVDYDLSEMCKAVADHTTDVLSALKDRGITSEWVQVGNETTNGMLWPLGKLAEGDEEIEGGWQRYAQLTAAGYDAVKKVFPEAIVIVHHDNAYQDHRPFYHNLLDNGGKFDMIGLSHYPMMEEWCHKPWQEMNALAEANVRDLISEFRCKVMIAEVGTVSAEEELSAVVMREFVDSMAAIDSCAGIFYWEPQVFNYWKPKEYEALGWGSYPMSCFSSEGKPQKALRIMFE